MGCTSGKTEPTTGKVGAVGGNASEKTPKRIILLGVGGSGKSTFSKQMQIIHHGAIDPELSKNYRGILLNNIILGLKAIGAQKTDLQISENYKKSRVVLSLDENWINWEDSKEKEKNVGMMKSLWADKGVREAWLDIKDSLLIPLDYLMDNIDRYVATNFVPTNEDMLRARQRTTGGLMVSLTEGKHLWELIDVGGQFSERSKWNNYFTERVPHAVIFFLALDEYNIENTELRSGDFRTKYDLAFSIFRDYMCSPGPVLDHNVCRIVFLNKMDLFQEKIRDDKKWKEFKEIFGYKGERSVNEAIHFIQQKLLDESAKSKKANIIVHFTNALDTALMTKVSSAIRTAIVDLSMKDLGLLN